MTKTIKQTAHPGGFCLCGETKWFYAIKYDTICVMKRVLVSLICLGVVPAFAGEKDDAIHSAQQIFEAARITCSGISDEIGRVANISKANTAVTAAGTVAAGGALAVGIKKSQIEEEINQLATEICDAGGCSVAGVTAMSDEEFLTSVIMPMAKIEELQRKLEKSKQLGNWRTGLMAGTVGTNLASAILSGMNKNQSELIQQVSACNQMIQAIPVAEEELKKAGVGSMHSEIVTQLGNAKTWCSQIEISDIEKIENRMKVVMGTSVAGTAVGIVGVGVSAAANSDKYMDAGNRLAMGEKEQKKAQALNTTANVMAGTNMAIGATETGMNISLVALTKKLIKRAEMCEEILNK